MNFEAMRRAVKNIAVHLGEDILLDKGRFAAALNDALPGWELQIERARLADALNLGVGKGLLKAGSSQPQRKAAFNMQLQVLIKSGLSPETAESILLAFTEALGWQIETQPPAPPRQPVVDAQLKLRPERPKSGSGPTVPEPAPKPHPKQPKSGLKPGFSAPAPAPKPEEPKPRTNPVQPAPASGTGKKEQTPPPDLPSAGSEPPAAPPSPAPSSPPMAVLEHVHVKTLGAFGLGGFLLLAVLAFLFIAEANLKLSYDDRMAVYIWIALFVVLFILFLVNFIKIALDKETVWIKFGLCKIPERITEIGVGCFKRFGSLRQVVFEGGNVKDIDCEAFRSAALRSLTLPDSVISIGDEAFKGCTSLQSAIIPDSVTSIGEKAFYGCRSLRSITIPDSVTSIGDKAFGGLFGGIPVVYYNGPAEGSPWGAKKHVRR